MLFSVPLWLSITLSALLHTSRPTASQEIFTSHIYHLHYWFSYLSRSLFKTLLLPHWSHEGSRSGLGGHCERGRRRQRLKTRSKSVSSQKIFAHEDQSTSSRRHRSTSEPDWLLDGSKTYHKTSSRQVPSSSSMSTKRKRGKWYRWGINQRGKTKCITHILPLIQLQLLVIFFMDSSLNNYCLTSSISEVAIHHLTNTYKNKRPSIPVWLRATRGLLSSVAHSESCCSGVTTTGKTNTLVLRNILWQLASRV